MKVLENTLKAIYSGKLSTKDFTPQGLMNLLNIMTMRSSQDEDDITVKLQLS